MNSLELLKLFRGLFLRGFLLALGFALLYGLVIWYDWPRWESLALRHFPHLSAQMLSYLIVNWYANLRFFLVFCLLIPGLSLHWTIKSLEKSTI